MSRHNDESEYQRQQEQVTLCNLSHLLYHCFPIKKQTWLSNRQPIFGARDATMRATNVLVLSFVVVVALCLGWWWDREVVTMILFSLISVCAFKKRCHPVRHHGLSMHRSSAS